MAPRLMLVAHAPTEATRRGAFPRDEGIEPGVEPVALHAAQVLLGPELRCRQTADALGWAGDVDPGFADLDAGRWRGRVLAEVMGSDPDDVADWLTGPTACPHGGEAMADLMIRVGAALDSRDWPDGRSIVLTSPLVVRAALVHLLRAPASMIFAIDVGPLTAVTVSGHGGRWVLQAMQPVRAWSRTQRS